jgi:hypothetical protein
MKKILLILATLAIVAMFAIACNAEDNDSDANAEEQTTTADASKFTGAREYEAVKSEVTGGRQYERTVVEKTLPSTGGPGR